MHGWGTFLKLAVPGTFMLAFEVWSVEITTFCTVYVVQCNILNTFNTFNTIQYRSLDIRKKYPNNLSAASTGFKGLFLKIN